MRVTNGMMTASFLNDLYKANEKFLKYSRQFSSNKRILRPSDDPIGTTRSIRIRNEIAQLEQFTSNVKDAKTYLTQAETALQQIDDKIYMRLTTLSEQALDGVMDKDQNLKSIADEVRQLRDELVNIANTRCAGDYIFGGFNTTKEPFAANGASLTYNGLDIINGSTADFEDEKNSTLIFKLSNNVSFDVGYTGIDLMGTGEDNLYNVMTQFIDELESGNFSNSGNFVEKFRLGQNHILALEADIGAKQNRLDYMLERYEDDSLNYEERRMDIEDIDQAEVISKMQLAETLYQATLQANSMILQPTLLNYL